MNFKDWNRIKIKLTSRVNFPRPKGGWVWWCSVGLNIGSEQNGNEGYERPVLVLKMWGTIFWGIPITSSDLKQKKKTSPLFYKIEETPYSIKDKHIKYLKGYLALNQMRVYDARRLRRRILKLEANLFEDIKRSVRAMI